VQQYLGKYRKGRIKDILPTDALDMTVEEALRKGKVQGVNVRKLITDTRDKFLK
jgi:hypothetical protein